MVGVARTSVLLAVVCAVVSASSYFIHFSDPHLDFNYKVNASVECLWHTIGVPCCHDLKANLTPEQRAPPFGHKNCELPKLVFEGIMSKIAKKYPDPLFVLINGDIASHDVFNEDPKTITEKWDYVFKIVKKNFGENIKIISTLGNSDAYPIEQMSENKTDEVVTDIAKVMYSHGLIHKDIPDEAIFSKHGYYKTSIPNSNVDVVVLNSVLDLKKNLAVDPQNPDPAGMYSWTEKKISESAAANRKVWLVGHVPPDYLYQYDREMNFTMKIVDKYVTTGTVTASFFGHTHTDSFRLIGMRNLKDSARFVGFLVPGMFKRAGIRIVDVDGDDLNIVDWHQYRLNMTASNDQDKIVLYRVYDFREYFGVPNVSPKTFQAISNKILTDEAYALKYLTARGGYAQYHKCNSTCRLRHYCSISFVETQDLHEGCLASFSKDPVGSIHH